jgi:protein MpaA
MRALAVAALVAAVAAPGAGAARRVLLGHSVAGRPIVAFELGDPRSRVRELVVGCIHGNESAGIAVAERLAAAKRPAGVDLWVVPDLNPDGVAADTRGNADGVDLNRNFPFEWRPLSGLFNSGSHALSEPESRIAARLILRLRPRVSIWFHQHLDVVDESGGDVAVERRFAQRTGLPLARLTRYPGSVASWENAQLPGSTAFVVELPAGPASPALSTRLVAAALAATR